MSAKIIKSLKLKRTAMRDKLNRFRNFITELSAVCNETSIPSGSTDAITLNFRFNNVLGLLQEFEQVQTELECTLKEDDIESQRQIHETFETDYYVIISDAQKLINRVTKSEKQQPLSVINDVTQNSINLTSVKLPTIQLPQFNGNYESWIEFKDTFTSLIHDNNSISSIQKYHYLLSALQGDAALVIKSFDISAENYAIAWSILCDRYNNDKLLIHNHVKHLFNLPNIDKPTSQKLRKMLDELNKHLRILNVLKQPTEYWGTLIVYMVTERFDTSTLEAWEQYTSSMQISLPELNHLNDFIKIRADLLESVEYRQRDNKNVQVVKRLDKSKVYSKYALVSTSLNCAYCNNQDHAIYYCKEFLGLSANSRIAAVKKLQLCKNCLKSGHNSKQCKKGSCKHCKLQHNTILHINPTAPANNSDICTNSNSNINLHSHNQFNCKPSVILSTAIVHVMNKFGELIKCRALLDSASQSNFVTEKVVQLIQASIHSTNEYISGISQISTQIQSSCTLEIVSMHTKFKETLPFLIVPNITSQLPAVKLNQPLSFTQNVSLADPTFTEPGDIDMLLGAQIFWNLLEQGQIDSSANKGLILQQTKLGWVVCGSLTAIPPKQSKCLLAIDTRLDQQLRQFWEIEEICTSKSSILTQEEIDCEKHFCNTHFRNKEGRFVVSIPLKEPINKLGDSRSAAIKNFYKLERKLLKNVDLRKQYNEFIETYISLGHMSTVNHNNCEVNYYLPHHAVYKNSSSTTSLRVVFNASSKSTSGVSFNDLQMIGPTMQSDMFAILLRFRIHKYVISADIRKMYRQVLINPKQRALQRIVWRSNPREPLTDYNLNTVTYGTASGSFLAIRSLIQLSYENNNIYPRASQMIIEDFYVDDLLSGSNDLNTLIQDCKDLKGLLLSGCFELVKWMSNSFTLMQQFSNEINADDYLHLGSHENTKVLGLLWQNKEDVLKYNIPVIIKPNILTKRYIASQIAQIFDPYGLIIPCTIVLKIILQKLWLDKLSWDETVPKDILETWLKIRDQLSELNLIKIPRHCLSNDISFTELHIFSDASERAYGACAYLRCVDHNKVISVELFCAKARVSPIKKLTIPRLELCGALIATRLYTKITQSINIKFNNVFFWTDSSVLLSWLKQNSKSLQVFVGNRIAEIQSTSNVNDWKHVSSRYNPADYLSRGSLPKELVSLTHWWRGPEWLSKPESEWPQSSFDILHDIPEVRKIVLVSKQVIHLFPLNKYSKLIKLQRVVATCLRFLQNCKGSRLNGPISVDEMHKSLQQGRQLSLKMHLTKLTPFLDDNGIMRVGGRTSSSSYSFDKIHPMLLPKKAHVTKLLFEHLHRELNHAGPQLLLYSIREKYWPLGGRDIARKTVFSCITCFKTKPTQYTPKMGNLPDFRITASLPFTITGVDYAGPYFVRDRIGRGAKYNKCYICLFICMTTKAVHIEAVTSLTTEAFIASLRRFISRRGKPSRLMSDNGRTFLGASNELAEFSKFISSNSNDISDTLTNHDIKWEFIPAYSPHFGGMWEAGIKSCKTHLKRVIGDAKLTFEEFYTILSQIECILNSRPLTPMSSDPADLRALTPAHFLIGRSLLQPADAELSQIKENRLSRFQRLQQIIQHFWTRWQREYVSELQIRTKWRVSQLNLDIGQLVLVKSENIPVTKWSLGRVVETCAGKDGVVRVAMIKTASGTIKRSFANICILPIENDC